MDNMLLTPGQVFNFIFMFYTHIRVLHKLAVRTRKRASPEMSPLLCKKHTSSLKLANKLELLDPFETIRL